MRDVPRATSASPDDIACHGFLCSVITVRASKFFRIFYAIKLTEIAAPSTEADNARTPLSIPPMPALKQPTTALAQ